MKFCSFTGTTSNLDACALYALGSFRIEDAPPKVALLKITSQSSWMKVGSLLSSLYWYVEI